MSSRSLSHPLLLDPPYAARSSSFESNRSISIIFCWQSQDLVVPRSAFLGLIQQTSQHHARGEVWKLRQTQSTGHVRRKTAPGLSQAQWLFLVASETPHQQPAPLLLRLEACRIDALLGHDHLYFGLESISFHCQKWTTFYARQQPWRESDTTKSVSSIPGSSLHRDIRAACGFSVNNSKYHALFITQKTVHLSVPLYSPIYTALTSV
ncbi:hypothetical protein BKA81DRAFT_54654 [Phyllosticta paracitricarpa]